MENKNYFKALFTNAVFYAGFVLGLLLVTAYAVCYGYGYIEKIVESSNAIVVLVDVLLALSLVSFAVSGFYKAKSQTVSFSEAFIGFLIATAIGGIYLIIGVKDHLVASIIVTAVSIILSVIVIDIRRKNFDHKYDTVESNSTFSSYYKAFFKPYGVISIIFAVVACAGMILLERANIVGHILTANSLKVVAIIGVAGVFVLFCILYSTRLRSKEIGIVDVALFMALGAVVGIIPVIFMVGKAFRVTAIVIELIALVLVVLLTVGVIKNTHVYTEEENMEIEGAKTGVGAYLKALIDKTNLVVAFGIACIFATLVTFVEGINVLSTLTTALNLNNTAVINVIVFTVIALFGLFVFADVRDYRITAIDSALTVWNITFVLLTILHFALFGGTIDVHFFFALIGLVIGLVLFFVRSAFVHYGEVTYKAVEKPVEKPVEEVKPVEETAVTEETAEEVEEAPTVVAEEIEAVETQEVKEVPKKLKRINSKKDFENYVRTGDDQLKENYSAIKNAFYSYGVHSRLTKTRENFSKKGNSMSKVKPEKALHLQAKLQVRGKYVKLFINLDPTKLDVKYFRHKNVADKSPDQATLVKIRSKLTLKRALELIDMLAVQEGYSKKKKFEPVDYAKEYSDENLTYMEKLGFDYMVKDSVTLAEVMEYNDEFAKKLVKTEVIAKPERYIYDEITLDALSDNFADGEVADLEAMRVKGLIKINANSVTVKPSEKLAKKLIVVANVIDPKAIEMIAIAGGESTQLVEN